MSIKNDIVSQWPSDFKICISFQKPGNFLHHLLPFSKISCLERKNVIPTSEKQITRFHWIHKKMISQEKGYFDSMNKINYSNLTKIADMISS